MALLRSVLRLEDATRSQKPSGDIILRRQPKRALELYHQAAQQGHAPSCCNLGSLYETGGAGANNGVRKSKKEAMRWYRRAALPRNEGGRGNAYAQFNLGRLLAQKEPEEAAMWLTRALESREGSSDEVDAWLEGTGEEAELGEEMRDRALELLQLLQCG
jgi:TPR repeat protein